ncbi:MAG: formylglycine-generating enzyme family protein [Deltaproteobacteria bacterium]|nr:formylglycine-generating enzyme family protein [Deltaproteobacteria bacterium]
MRAKYPELAYQWALACRHQDSLTSRALPEGWDPEQIAWAFKESERYWRIWQDGSSLVIASDEWRPGTEEAPRASPVGGITTCRSFLSAESREQSAPITLFSYKKIDLSQAKAVSLGQLEHLRGEWESLKLETIPKPSWASEIGRDSIGLYADFTYQGATQRLRWINPGSFIIGSPEDEPGRYDNERQHRVTLTRGYWLADTPCTQALWQAVMGENPSYFKTPERPVENVSWEDCQRFLERIDGLIPDLGLRLPTEAEWEYACRAATSTALYSGPIEIRGECDAPALDPIAWYSGNSGEEFELENGWDSSEWPNKQYEHTRAGTHPVKRKNPNDWGLYDMLGNVWEWCDDWYGEYPSKSARRVLRGGGWFDDARYARSACRLRLGPGYRYNFIGFRFARGQ